MLDRHPMARQIRILLGVGCFALGAAAFADVQLSRSGPDFHGTAYPDTPRAPAFRLTDHLGRPAALEDFAGHPVLLFFGFTECPDFCPLTLARLSEITREDRDLADVRILLVTVDPETDTPAKMAAYVEGFGAPVTGLTGTPAELAPVYQGYGVYAQETAGHGGGMTLAHTPVVFGIDRAGKIQVLIHPDERRELVAEDIRKLARIGA